MFKSLLLLISVFAIFDAAYAQRIRVPIWVTDGTNQQRLVFGVDPVGTVNFDSGLDQFAPPSPPAGGFDARLRIQGIDDFIVDVRDNSSDQKMFNVKYQAASGLGPIILNWDSALLASLGSFQIVDEITGSLFGPVDMKTTNSLDISSAGGLLDNGLRILVTPNTAANGPPSVHADTSTADPTTGAVIDVLGNDTDADGDELDPVFRFSDPSDGIITFNADHTITYTPAPGFLGTDRFVYVVNDDHGNTGEAEVIVRVNLPPIASDDIVSTDEDIEVTIDVSANDNDADGTIEITSVMIVRAPSRGTAEVDLDTGDIIYIPTNNFNGLDSLRYTIHDNDGAISNEATVIITVDPVNDPPVFTSDVKTNARVDGLYTYQITTEDIDGDNVSITGTLIPDWLSFADNGDGTGTLTGTPTLDEIGDHSVELNAADTAGGTASQDFTIAVGVNTPPSAEDDEGETSEESSVTIDVLTNDSDEDGTIDATTVMVSTDPANGATSVDGASGEITYTPDEDFFGVDTFEYTVEDDEGAASDPAVVTVTVSNTQDAPVAGDDAAATNEDTSVDINVLANDDDVDGDALMLSITVNPSNGTAGVDDGGTPGDPTDDLITYAPDANYFGDDTFGYQIDDGNGDTDEATVTVTVNPIQDPPVAQDDDVTTDEDTAVDIDALANDVDVDGDILSLRIIADPSDGTASVDDGGTPGNPADDIIRYVPDADFSGEDVFEYEVDDGNGNTDEATITVTVNPVNDPPVAADDAATTDEDVSVEIDVLTNDNDIDDTLAPGTVTVTSDPENGSTTVNVATGAITYDPDENFTGNDAFTYTVGDNGGGTSNEATVTVTIDPINDPPVFTSNPSNDARVDEQYTYNVTTSDVDGDLVSITGAALPGWLTLTDNGDGTGVLSGTPSDEEGGDHDVVLDASDKNGGTAVQEFRVTVIDNLPPTAVDDEVITPEDTSIDIDIVANDSDPDGDVVSILRVDETSAEGGLISINENGTVRYNPPADFNGADTFSYWIKDDNDHTNRGTVTVTVSPVNDEPVAVDDVISIEEDAGSSEDLAPALDVLGNDEDVDGDALTLSIKLPPVNGFAYADNDEGVVRYRPATNFFGSDSLVYGIDDGTGSTDQAIVWITVEPVNDAPIFTSTPAITAMEGVPFSYTVTTSDVDGDEIIVTVLNKPRWLTRNGDTFSGTPGSEDVGTNMPLLLEATDGNATPVRQSFNIIVEGDPDADGVGDEVENAVSNAAGGFCDADGDGADDGTGDGNGDGICDSEQVNVTSIPNGEDGGYISIASTESSTLKSVTSTPPAADLPEGTEFPIGFIGFEVGGIQEGGSSIVTLHLEQPQAVNSYWKYGPTPGDTSPHWYEFLFDGSTGAEIMVNEATGEAGSIVLHFVDGGRGDGDLQANQAVSDPGGPVAVSNAAPVAADDEARTNMDSAVNIDVLANDTDPDGDALTIIAVSEPDSGTVEIVEGGQALRYTPDPGFTGADVFTYTIRDKYQAQAQAAVVVLINSTPFAVNDEAETDEDVPVRIEVLTNDSDPDGDSLWVSEVDSSTAGGGLAVRSADSTAVQFTPKADFFGTDTFTYTLRDAGGGSMEASVSVTVNPINDAPRFESEIVFTEPVDGTEVIIGGATGGSPGDPLTPFTISWNATVDPEGDEVNYTWQLSDKLDFSDLLMNEDVSTATQFETTFGAMASLLAENGVELSGELTLFHRVNASDGESVETSATASVTLIRGMITTSEQDGIPTEFELAQNYPNPFNPTTTIRYAVPKASFVEINLIDVLGHRVKTIVSAQMSPGRYEVTLDATDLASGLYFYRLEAENVALSRRLFVIK